MNLGGHRRILCLAFKRGNLLPDQVNHYIEATYASGKRQLHQFRVKVKTSNCLSKRPSYIQYLGIYVSGIFFVKKENLDAIES